MGIGCPPFQMSLQFVGVCFCFFLFAGLWRTGCSGLASEFNMLTLWKVPAPLLKSSKLRFRFPDPGYLEGVKSKNKALLKMRNVGFTYPGTTRKILRRLLCIPFCKVSRIYLVKLTHGLGPRRTPPGGRGRLGLGLGCHCSIFYL